MVALRGHCVRLTPDTPISQAHHPLKATPRMTKGAKTRLLLSLILPFSVHGFVWPFTPKRFKSNALIDAGSLGLKDVQGRVAAFGDFDGDQ